MGMQLDLVLVEHCVRGSDTRALILETHLVEVIATRNTTFHDKCEKEQEARGSKGEPVSLQRTGLRSHWGIGSRTGLSGT